MIDDSSTLPAPIGTGTGHSRGSSADRQPLSAAISARLNPTCKPTAKSPDRATVFSPGRSSILRACAFERRLLRRD